MAKSSQQISNKVLKEWCRLINEGEFAGFAESLAVYPNILTSYACHLNMSTEIDWDIEQNKDENISRIKQLLQQSKYSS